MEVFFYILFGFLDVFLILTFIFRIFRWPLRYFIRNSLIIAIVCSLESYTTRMILNISEFDTLIQMVTIMFLLRYLIKVNLYHSLTSSIIGVLSYSVVQIGMYQLLNNFDYVNVRDALSSSGLGIFTIQFVGELTGVLLAALFYKFNLGFSFISIPPHDKKDSFTLDEKINLLFHFIAVIVLFSATYWITTYDGIGLNVIMLLDTFALVIVVYLAFKKEYST